jgi:hypothetical protein
MRAVNRVVEEGTDVGHEEGVKEGSNVFLVREGEGTFVGDPNTFEMHRSDFHNMLLLLAFQHPVSSTSGHASHIQKLGAIDHMIIFTSGNASSSNINLKTQCSFIFP